MIIELDEDEPDEFMENVWEVLERLCDRELFEMQKEYLNSVKIT
jgi:hypothetical protein